MSSSGSKAPPTPWPGAVTGRATSSAPNIQNISRGREPTDAFDVRVTNGSLRRLELLRARLHDLGVETEDVKVDPRFDDPWPLNVAEPPELLWVDSERDEYHARDLVSEGIPGIRRTRVLGPMAHSIVVLLIVCDRYHQPPAEHVREHILRSIPLSNIDTVWRLGGLIALRSLVNTAVRELTAHPCGITAVQGDGQR